MFVVVSYDIPDDKRRNRVADLLTDFGQRVQKSVFECYLDKRSLRELHRLLEPLLAAEEDDLRFYILCEKCLERVQVLGKGELSREPAYYVV